MSEKHPEIDKIHLAIRIYDIGNHLQILKNDIDKQSKNPSDHGEKNIKSLVTSMCKLYAQIEPTLYKNNGMTFDQAHKEIWEGLSAEQKDKMKSIMEKMPENVKNRYD